MLAGTIIKAIQARGYKLKIGIGEKRNWGSKYSPEAEECYFDIKGEKVRFAISEKMNRVERSLGEKEKRELEKYGHILYRWKYVSSGILKVKILEAYYREGTWMDNDKKAVEEQIPLIVKAILTAANNQKKSRILTKIEELRKAEEKRLAELEELLEEQEEHRIDDLMAQVKKWKKAVAIRDYLNAFEDAVETDDGHDDHSMKYWLGWAYNYADKLDPLSTFEGRKIK